MSFDPTPYLIEMGRDKKGNPKMYLQAAHRVLWFRSDNPLGNIVTELVQLDPFPVFRAVVTNGEGVVLASGYGCAQAKAGSVYAGREVEKAETAAIARALGHAGYGSQFGGDADDDDHLADSPTERRPAAKTPPAPINPNALDRRVPDTRKKADAPKETADFMLEPFVEAGIGKSGKPYIRFEITGKDEYVYAFTRDAFRQAGWYVDGWTHEGETGRTAHELAYYPRVTAERDGEMWKIIHVTPLELCDAVEIGKTA